METTDAEFMIVPYEGGGPTETALLQGEIDVAVRSMYNSANVDNETLCLTVYAEENPEPDLTDEAPPINEALGTGIDYEPSNGIQFYFVSADAAEEYPDRFQYLVDAFYEAHHNEEYHKDLKEIGEAGKRYYNDPDETEQILRNAYETYEEFIPLFNEYMMG